MLREVADGVWVRQSSWVWSNAVVIRAEEGLTLVDPGIGGADLAELADDVERLGVPVVAGFSTHPHWDHLLWHPRFGDVPRYGTPTCARVATEARERAQTMAAESAEDVPLDLVARLDPLPAGGGAVPGEVLEHDAHAPGHAALLLPDRGVLVAGDLFSDVLIPLLDPGRPGQLDAFDAALDLLAPALAQVDVLVPGHGAVALGPEVGARLVADRAYLAALRRGEEPADPRLSHEWLGTPHRANQAHGPQASG